MSYGNLKTVAGWTVAAEDDEMMQWLAVLEPDQRREGAASTTVEQQLRSAHWCNVVQSSAHVVQSSNIAVFLES